MAERNDENNIIISRMQQRRGLKQDLPQPLRPGEFGFAVDSQQLYIGADPTNPAAADYNNASYFETTVNAREHTISIAANQIIFFTVPFIKYSQGEFTGIGTVKQWTPTFARSIIDAEDKPECKFTSSDYPVFPTHVTGSTESTIAVPATNTTIIKVNNIGLIDDYDNMRIGDQVVIQTTTGQETANIVSLFKNVGTGDFDVEIDATVSVDLNANFTCNYVSITNFRTGLPFNPNDLVVRKNGIKLQPEANSSLVIPSAQYDYTFSMSNSRPTGIHTLQLRTAPGPQDSMSVCYYSNTDVITAITGNPLTGNISTVVDYPSFYTAYDIPDYRKFDNGLIRLSETTGLGFIGLQNKHIQSYTDGVNVASTTGLVLGSLLISRDDETFPATACVKSNANVRHFITTIGSIESNKFSPINETSGAYRFNRTKINSTQNFNIYFHDHHFNVIDVDANVGQITFEIPDYNFYITRTCNVELASLNRYPGNGFTNNVSATDNVVTIKTDDSAGIEQLDWVRVIDPAGTNELHDTVFRVIAVRQGQIDIRVDAFNVASANAVPNFTANATGLHYINHGEVEANISSTVQFVSGTNELTTEVGNIVVSSITGGYATGTYDYFRNEDRITGSTYFIHDFTIADSTNLPGVTGVAYYELADDYDGIVSTPILAIDLSANTSLAEAVTTINKPLVSTKIGFDNEQIFPEVDYIPQNNGDLNRIYLTQDPGYSSVSVGGLEFTLFEDRNVPTLSVLGLSPGKFNRENNTIRSKFEKWINELQQSRDINLFSSIAIGGEQTYKTFPYVENDPESIFDSEVISSKFDTYALEIDQTYNDVLFCDRQEAAAFNNIVNGIYLESSFDRQFDPYNGVRGLLTVRNNIELQSREQSGIGLPELNFPTTNQVIILRTASPNTFLFQIPIKVYNSYVIEYSIASFGETAIDTYNRVGGMYITINKDIPNNVATATGPVAINDVFSSVWNKLDGAPVIEPRFYGEVSADGLFMNFLMEAQYRIPSVPTPGDVVAHSLDADLLLKWVARRWNSFED